MLASHMCKVYTGCMRPWCAMRNLLLFCVTSKSVCHLGGLCKGDAHELHLFSCRFLGLNPGQPAIKRPAHAAALQALDAHLQNLYTQQPKLNLPLRSSFGAVLHRPHPVSQKRQCEEGRAVHFQKQYKKTCSLKQQRKIGSKEQKIGAQLTLRSSASSDALFCQSLKVLRSSHCL